MFRPAEIGDWWPYAQDFNDLKYGRVGGERKCVLKCAGYAFVMQQIDALKPKRVLEIGHGPTSPLFDYLGNSDVELWGIDRFSNTYTTASSQYDEFRRNHPKARFTNGFFGQEAYDLPDDYFDCVCSVSVLEHVPMGRIPQLCEELGRVTRKGALSLHSVDVYLADRQFKHQNVRLLFDGHLQAGFEWLEPMNEFKVEVDPVNVLMEDARTVMENFLGHQPIPDRRWPGNYIAVLMAAVKRQGKALP